MREDLPDRRRVGDEGAEADVAATSGAREREVFGDPCDELRLWRREVSWERGCSWLRAPSPRPSPKGRGSGSGGKASRAFAGGSGSGSQGEERPQAGDELVGIGERVGVERTGGGSAGGRALSPRTACSKSRQ
jgi:hypothetical protein